MANISQLGAMRPIEPLDLDAYQDNKGFSALPKKGVYTVTTPEFSDTSFTRTQAGALSAKVDPTIVGPTNEGYTIKFTNVSAKEYKRGGVTVSQMGDYLRACGHRGRLQDEQALADAVSATANTTAQIEVDWRAYNKNTKFQVEGMERFPSDGQGGHLPYFLDPVEKEMDEEGKVVVDANGVAVPKKLRANLTVTRWIPATT